MHANLDFMLYISNASCSEASYYGLSLILY